MGPEEGAGGMWVEGFGFCNVSEGSFGNGVILLSAL
jgi:hypothetical protein